MLACKVFHFSSLGPLNSLLLPQKKKKPYVFCLCYFQVANVKKETTFHWYKEDDEIVPETPPNVMSGACALPLQLV